MKINALKLKLKKVFTQSTRWLIPGLGVKRWFAIILGGTTLLGVGLALLVLDVYRTAPNTWWLPILSAASLRFLPRIIRVMIFGGIGLGILAWGVWGMNKVLMAPYMRPGKTIVDTLTAYRRKGRGPRIVAIGGGTGLSTLLRGLKSYTYNLAAIVTVADDGGSSGRLRRTMGILPPGDIRSCLAALSDDEDLVTQLFQYRFAKYDKGGLGGHSFGNLFISALSDITGSFEEAVAESGRVLAVHGRVLPSTLHDVQLSADITLPHNNGEVRIIGESRIPETVGEIQRVWLEPNNPPAFPEAIQAILGADMIIIGPGSLYTSIMPNMLVRDIAEAFQASRALKIFVCNVATQPGETQEYSCGDHIRAIEEHLGEGPFDIIVTNYKVDNELPPGIQWVTGEDELEPDYQVYRADVVDEGQPWRHDSAKLSKVLMDLFQERTGPLVL